MFVPNIRIYLNYNMISIFCTFMIKLIYFISGYPSVANKQTNFPTSFHDVQLNTRYSKRAKEGINIIIDSKPKISIIQRNVRTRNNCWCIKLTFLTLLLFYLTVSIKWMIVLWLNTNIKSCSISIHHHYWISSNIFLRLFNK